MPHDTRDQVVDFVRTWSDKTELPTSRLVRWVGVGRSKFYDWIGRFGKVNEHNALVPRDFWLEDWEKQAIIDFYLKHPLEGYRRLTFMMLDRDVVAVSPSSVYRVLSAAELLRRWNGKTSKKGTGFIQPLKPHEHWHIDVSYVNLCGTFYYLCSVLDGLSRYIVHWEIRKSMKTDDVQIIVQRAREKFPEARARAITDNGRILRNLIQGANYLQSHILHFYQLAALDYVDVAACADYSGNDPDLKKVKDFIARGHLGREQLAIDLGRTRAIAGLLRRLRGRDHQIVDERRRIRLAGHEGAVDHCDVVALGVGGDAEVGAVDVPMTVGVDVTLTVAPPQRELVVRPVVDRNGAADDIDLECNLCSEPIRRHHGVRSVAAQSCWPGCGRRLHTDGALGREGA